MFGRPAGNAYPSTHLVPSLFWDLIMLQLLRPTFPTLPCFSTFHLEYHLIFSPFFSAPEPKAQVHYCDHALSVVRRPSVRPSSLTFHIFDFSSETTEWNLTKLYRKVDLNVLYQVCVFRADRKNKMAALASDWLIHFRLLL